MMLKCKRREASLVTVAAENAGLSERTSGCRRMQGCVHFSKASRSDDSSLPIRNWRTLFRYCHPIHRVTEAMERLMEEDAAADRPFIAALVISKARAGLPGPGFFDCARRLGRFAGNPNGQDARTFHAERRLRLLGRFGRQRTTRTSCSQTLTRAVTEAADRPDHHQSQRSESMSGGGYPKFRNDRGVPEICIGVKEFMCIGESPPQDHPHVYINMGEADTILCPYCATRFRFDPRLTPLDADPPESVFADHYEA
jgi:uncharacterized Zn-finger protein